MTGWDAFNKYVGIQGIMGLGLVSGYIVASFTAIVLPVGYTEIMAVIVGFYFARNGKGIVASAKKNR